MSRPLTKLTPAQDAVVKRGANTGVGATEVQRQLEALGLKASLPTVGRWLQRAGGKGKRPTLGVPRGGKNGRQAAALAPGGASAEAGGGSGGVEPTTRPVDVQSADDLPAMWRGQLTELQAQLRAHQQKGNVAAVASLQRMINQTGELLARMEQPAAPDPDAAPDVQVAAAEAREQLRRAVARAIERRA